MLDFSHLPTSTNADVQIFNANGVTAGANWAAWQKPRGASMVHILCIGAGGNGGNGAVGAASTAAGGGGGGSGGQSVLVVPAALLPDVLYCEVPFFGASTFSEVFIAPGNAAANTLIFARGGANGGNAAGATAGALGAAGAVATISSMPLAGLGFYTLLAGQAGIIGGTTVAGAALTLPTTGLLVTGGTGGAGIGNAASTGFAGGAFTIAGGTFFPPQPGGLAAGSQTTPAGGGSNGFDRVINGLSYSYGGTGGGSTGGAATGAGLKAGNGGAGGIGCGGGGGGGGFTGSTQGLGGRGGPGQVIITAW